MSAADLVARFRSLAEERLRRLNDGLLALEQGTAAPGVADEVMREVHTLKGEARMLGLLAANVVAHRVEDVLLHARRADAFRDAALLEVAYAGLDLLSTWLREPEDVIAAPDEPRAAAFDARVRELLAARGAAPSAAPPSPAVAAGPVPSSAGAAPVAGAGPAAADEPRGRAPERGGVVRVGGGVVDELTRSAGVLGMLQAHVDRAACEAQGDAEETLAAVRALRDAAAAGDGSLPGGLEASVGRLRERAEAQVARLRGLREACFAAALRHQRVRDAVASLRLAEVASLFGRFPRTVRDLARELGKEAQVEVRGGAVGADQQVLEALADPLLHLVRNAVDHGLETPSVREAIGKPRRGTVFLEAAQAGRFVEIVVRDDGRGIDPRAVGEAAVRKGLLSEGDVARMSVDEVFDQLFRPAFSTKDETTDVSGRGVGLDVVKRTVEGLGGSVRVRSEVGRGAAFVLRVPVSSALVDALAFEAGAGVFAVPAASVERVLVVGREALEPTGPSLSVRLPGGARAVVLDLARFLPSRGREAAPPEPGDDVVRLVVAADGERRVALRASRFLGELPLVQEALDPFLSGLRGVTGTAVLEDGRIAVLLQVVQVLQWVREERLDVVPEPAPAVPAPRARTALVVEDSDLTRALVVAALAQDGYRVVEAANGREALDRLRGGGVDVVVTDLEMPVMDGVALLRALRADPALRALPALVFSTRQRPESKREAAEAGADAYLVKSEFEEAALRAAVARLVASRAAAEGTP